MKGGAGKFSSDISKAGTSQCATRGPGQWHHSL